MKFLGDSKKRSKKGWFLALLPFFFLGLLLIAGLTNNGALASLVGGFVGILFVGFVAYKFLSFVFSPSKQK